MVLQIVGPILLLWKKLYAANWSLLPVCALLAVRTGSIAGGMYCSYLSGYPEFASWFGTNLSKMKKLEY